MGPMKVLDDKSRDWRHPGGREREAVLSSNRRSLGGCDSKWGATFM